MDLLTPMSSFGVYSEDGHFLYGNFSLDNKEKNWDSYSKGDKSIGLSNYIISIAREKDILIINYPLTMQFRSERLRKVLPNAEVAIVFLVFLQLITIIVLWSNRFAKRVNSELKALLITTEKIQEQNLDFNVDNSNIEEIDMVLKGIDKMKNSLKIALEEQWLLEKQKREQVSALAHDIKTPLTIVKGNTELLKETELTKEQKNYCNYIKESSEQMDEYIQQLLTFTKKEIDKGHPNEKVKVIKVLNSLKNQSEALSKIKNINIVWEIDVEENLYIKGNENELERAMMNIIINAFDFSPNGSTIAIYGVADNYELTIQVIDQGNGFSKKMLRYGKEQFFMEKESRTKTGHHGLGLYIANTIITKYNGELALSNDENGGGAVTVKISIFQKDD
ncbi:sensor histidine kinase [Clostridium aceticum]|nr:HAMP domain-containing sensor histidine kinase [Clostridium aceticum]